WRRGPEMDSIAILVVEDEESVRTCLAEFLCNAGYQVRIAAGGAEALEMLSAGSFDGVLLDVVMPGLSGLEVLKRSRAVTSSTPVIVLSALSGADDVVRAMKLGATDSLSKPFSHQELEEALSRALRAPSPPGNGSRSPEVPEETVEPLLAPLPEERFD